MRTLVLRALQTDFYTLGRIFYICLLAFFFDQEYCRYRVAYGGISQEGDNPVPTVGFSRKRRFPPPRKPDSDFGVVARAGVVFEDAAHTVEQADVGDLGDDKVVDQKHIEVVQIMFEGAGCFHVRH